MRVVVKGGVWKNTEDEILKVAVMKYGKNQWARISSLLTRKTPKQCKARWYEWLDPSIKKTEWAKDEDEKLLHLAKLMPTQWRTIAPIIGRTPAQCLERYQKLLDEAERELTGQGDDDEHGPSADEVRRLRPGEIDPDPEVKPARPDPVDMDEDEKEMLSEARARLANTQGKKAKRKARERQLEESRRIAALQKRRELKASGIHINPNRKRRDADGMDYNADIPFARKPLPGFYDTSDELTKKQGLDIGEYLLTQLEGKRKAEAEADERKKDIKRRKLRAAGGPAGNVAFVGANGKAIFNADTEISTRAPLHLPAPQMSDREIEELAKMGASQVPLEYAQGGDDLVSEYTATPRGMLPMRTPRTAPEADKVRAQAREIIQNKALNTPLLGEEQHASMLEPSTTILPTETPTLHTAETPRTLPGATPYRDRMQINTPSHAGSVFGETPREQRHRATQQRSQLKQALLSLPKPKNDFQIVVPEPSESSLLAAAGATPSSNGVAARADKSDLEFAADREREAQRAAERALESQTVQRSLPRPAYLPTIESLARHSVYKSGTPLHNADQLIAREMLALLTRDAVEHPVPGAPPVERVAEYADVTVEQLEAARGLVAQECTSLDHAKVSLEPVEVPTDLVMDPASGLAYRVHELSLTEDDAQRTGVPTAARVYAATAQRLQEAAQRSAKLEAKFGVQFGGYLSRSAALGKQLVGAAADVQAKTIRLAAVDALAHDEANAIPVRVGDMRERLERAKREQRELQARYAELAATWAELQKQ